MQNDVRLIDANALINVLCEKLRSIDNGRTMRQAAITVADGMRIMELEYCIGLIQCADIIDAVPVVRCRDCYYREKPSCCPYQYSGFKVEPDWYCPMGVKMDAQDMDVPTKDGGAADANSR